MRGSRPPAEHGRARPGDGETSLEDLWAFPRRWAVRRSGDSPESAPAPPARDGDGEGYDPSSTRLIRGIAGESSRLIVGAELISLFDALQRGPMVIDAPGTAQAASLAALVLDGVLEVDFDGDGWSSGPSTLAALGWSGPADPPQDRLARLSDLALDFAAVDTYREAHSAGERLYRFNALPYSPRWHRRLGSGPALASFLRLAELPQGPSLGVGEPWITWTRRGRAPDRPVAKLYVSPDLEDLPPLLARVVELFAEDRAAALKVGGTVEQLLRPDRLVVYFGPDHDLREFAASLASVARTRTPHGVPFTADLGHDGLLSWGVDPPARLWIGGRSWRRTVTTALGSALVMAASERLTEAEATIFAKARASLQGIDPRTWQPWGAEPTDAPA